MTKLLIIGAGGHGRVIADIALAMGKWDEIAFLDDRADVGEVLGLKVVGKLSQINQFAGSFTNAFVAIGNNKIRYEWINRLKEMGFALPIIKHPSSIVSKFAEIGEGTVLMPGSIINASSIIGQGCIINTNASLDHDCDIGNAVHISPGASIGGTVKIGERSWICIGASIANNINIGNDTVIAAGAAVINDVPDNVLAAGVPAIIKKNRGDSN